MKKIIQRLLMFFIGLPLLVSIVLLLPMYHHLAVNMLTVVFSALGAVEFSAMLSRRNVRISKAGAAVLGALPPLAMFLVSVLDLNNLFVPAVFAAASVYLLVSGIFTRAESLDGFIGRLAAGFAVLVYPGMLLAWLVRMSRAGEHAGIIILVFLCLVFANDSAAWAAGMLFGKGNQGLIPVSPNKSVAGFIGGAIASVAAGILAARLFPAVFVPNGGASAEASVLSGALLGLLTGIAAVFGDLAESAIKRSAGVKDSGKLILGRGGVLDSVDSIALAAPVFYLVFNLLFPRS